MAVDWTRPIQTRDGRKAEYRGTIKNEEYSRLVVIQYEDEIERPATYLESGRFVTETSERADDIINVPPQPVTVEIGERWANVYFSDVGGLHLNVFHGKIAAAENAKQAHPHYICSFKLPSTIQGEVLSP